MNRRDAGLLLVLFTLLGVTRGAIAVTNDLFVQGREEYGAGQFADAAKSFRAALECGPASGTLVNLGLTEWRRGRAGTAILAWEQARWIDPFNQQANGNLTYARQLTGVEPPDFSWYERVSIRLPASAWAWIVAGSLWLAIGLTVLPGAFRWRKSAWPQALAALGLTVFFASLPAHYGIITRNRIGFVLQKDAALRLTPTAEAEAVTKLPAGQPARELRTRGNYVLVRTSHGQGWLERNEFGRVCQE